MSFHRDGCFCELNVAFNIAGLLWSVGTGHKALELHYSWWDVVGCPNFLNLSK